jgi:acid phosphatase class B
MTNQADLFIMNAKDHITGKKKSTIQEIIDVNQRGDLVIYVADRETTIDKVSKLFITSYGSSMSEPTTYTEDTGHGHRNKNKGLWVCNTIWISDGKIVSQSNSIGFDEKRPLWVCK